MEAVKKIAQTARRRQMNEPGAVVPRQYRGILVK